MIINKITEVKYDLKAVAEEAITNTQGIIQKNFTHLSTNALSQNEQDEISQAVSSTRKHGRTSELKVNFFPDFYRLDFDLALYRFEKYIEGIRTQCAGNCSECAVLVYQYVALHYPELYVYLASIKEGDHVFVVISRTKIDFTTDPIKWDAYFIDPWANKSYDAKNYLTELKDYRRVEENGKRVNQLVDFNPKFQSIEKVPLNDDEEDISDIFLQAFNTESNLSILKIYFKVKIAFIDHLLDRISAPIGAAENAHLSISKKMDEIKYLKNLIAQCKNKIYLTNNYFDLRMQLKQDLVPLVEKFGNILSPVSIQIGLYKNASIVDKNVFLEQKGANIRFQQAKIIGFVNQVLDNSHSFFTNIVNCERDFLAMVRLEELKFDSGAIDKVIDEQILRAHNSIEINKNYKI